MLCVWPAEGDPITIRYKIGDRLQDQTCGSRYGASFHDQIDYGTSCEPTLALSTDYVQRETAPFQQMRFQDDMNCGIPVLRLLALTASIIDGMDLLRQSRLHVRQSLHVGDMTQYRLQSFGRMTFET